jgi:hypothetical protein
VSASAGDPFATIYHLLDELQAKHVKMAGLVGEYKELVEDLEERPDAERLRLARSLPGARYAVASTYVREAWLKVDAEIRRLFPENGPG